MGGEDVEVAVRSAGAGVRIVIEAVLVPLLLLLLLLLLLVPGLNAPNGLLLGKERRAQPGRGRPPASGWGSAVGEDGLGPCGCGGSSQCQLLHDGRHTRWALEEGMLLLVAAIVLITSMVRPRGVLSWDVSHRARVDQ